VRDLIEELASQHVERGVEVERHNVRGVVSKAIFEGGRQERALAEEARGWARASARWPRTAAMLLSVAQMWDAMADREDQRARHDEMRFE
jgi:alpha/beta superfamily hydrolase